MTSRHAYSVLVAMLLTAAALVLLPASGLAQSAAQTRVGASAVLVTARAGDFTPLAAVSQLGKAHAYDGNASGSLLAADGVDLYTGVKTPGACNNKILVSVSTDAGAHFTGAATNPRSMATAGTPEQAGRDQFWQWSGFSTTGAFATSYYDRQYGDDETRGNSDVTISGSRNLSGFATARVTSSSMPPPTEFSGVFFGDYSGLAVAEQAFPLWMDTRDAGLFVCPRVSPPAVCLGTEASGFQAGVQANDQDIFTTGVSIPIPDKEQGTGG